MRTRVLVGVVLVAAMVASCPSPARATQVLALDLPTLGRDAQVVAEGTVLSQRGFWNARRTRILTAIDLEIDRTHKGAPAQRLTVVQAGGEVDGMRMTVHGITQWRTGEKVVVFLERAFDDMYRVTGFSQGKFRVETDANTGAEVAVRPQLGVQTVGGDAGAVRMPLDRLLERARLTVREER